MLSRLFGLTLLTLSTKSAAAKKSLSVASGFSGRLISQNTRGMADSGKNAAVVKIGTHNGCFHCDEVTACFMLKQLPQYRDAEIVRTRDQKKLDGCDIVVDVGGVYNPEKGRFDHHQREFTETFHSIRPDKPWLTKLSSAGLVYCHFGERVIAQMTKRESDDPFVLKAFDMMYENFIQEIDAIDNGVKQFPQEPDQLPAYSVHTGLSARVGYLNPWWNADAAERQSEDKLFAKAMELVGAEFADRLRYYSDCWWAARQIVEAAFNDRRKHDAKGRLLVLDSQQGGLPWKGHLYELERQSDCLGNVLFTFFADNNGTWRVQAVPPDEKRGFENRLALAADWRGLRDDELSAKSGIDGCVFVHSSGFIGGNRTFEGAVQMARRTIEIAEAAKEAAASGLTLTSSAKDVAAEDSGSAKKRPCPDGQSAVTAAAVGDNGGPSPTKQARPSDS